MRTRSIVLWSSATVLVLGFLLLYFLYTNLNAIVLRSIERYGSAALGTSVSVDKVSILPSKGTGLIEGVRVSEPEGFGGGNAISFEEIELSIEIGSLAERQPIVIDLIRVTAPFVRYAVDSAGKSNLSVLQENIRRYNNSDVVKDEQAAQADSTPTLISIRKFVFEKGRVKADLSRIGLKPIEVELPAIREENLGRRQGAPPSHLAVKLSQKFVTKAIVAIGASEIGLQLDRLLREVVGEQRADKFKNLLRKVVPK